MNKTLVVRLSGILIGTAGLWVMFSQQQQRPPVAIAKVTDNLYVVTGAGGNVAVMPTGEGVLIVDDKFAQDVPEIVAKIKTVSDKPIRYILNTHQHGDHTGGNELLMGASAEVISHKNARANMAAQKMPGLARITFNDETQVFLGGHEVRAKHLGRGHTNGDAFILFPGERVLHTGDMFVAGAPFIDYSSGGSLAEWDKTIGQALQLDFDTVIPGHGPVMKKADLAKWQQTLATLRTRVKEACPGGADAVKKIKLDDIGMTVSPLFERSIPGMCQELR